ncbi:variable large family protein, partial [Borreliella garinii]|uniref:variable large family protein n=1 Tax=Borreliella garinii TaxID=29519 RepID=UPI001AEFFD49
MIAKKFNGWLEKMLKAAGEIAKAVADNDGTKIGESVNNGVGADADSVKGIATGMKGIIDAAKEGGVKFETADVVKDDNVNNKEAGKLFGTRGGGDAAAGDVAKAAAAVGVVSGEQILKAIAAAAGDTTNHDGKRGNAAENAIQAAI